MVDRLLTQIAGLFEVRDPQTRLDNRAALMLALILIAGTLVRFWGLGAVGLHGDEKTMGLPTVHLVEHGTPRLPSGMFYPRALGQLYLMAGSVLAFGQNEWALRLPSAICGLLLIGLAWSCGRRFLTPAWNLAFTAAVALLPDFIEDSQTARMYVFLVTSVAAFMALVFQWERTNRAGYLAAAVAAMLVGLQFHTLAIFAAFIVLIPGILHGDRRRFWHGLLAFAVIVAGFVAIDTLISNAYPQNVAADSDGITNGPQATLIPHIAVGWLALALVPAMLCSILALGWRSLASALPARIAAALLGLGLVCALTLHYHLAALLVIAGLVVARRDGPLSVTRVSLFLAIGFALALIQAAYLHTHAAGTPRQIAGLMLGWPSVWPFLAIAQGSALAFAFAATAVACGLWQLAHRRKVPDHVLLFVLGVWIPLLMIGYMRWNIPQRYAEAQMMPLLLSAFAAAQWASRSLSRWVAGRTWGSAQPGFGALAAAVACVLVIDPSRVADVVDSGYTDHPDHKGAAQYIESVHPGPRDILVAEDVLEQTYYLGRVDYWLVNKDVGSVYLHRVKGRWLDFYTNTPLLGTGEELRQLVQRTGRGAIYVIGSGENLEDGRKLMRGYGIAEELQSPQFKVVFRGRDGVTEVWKAEAPVATTLTAARD